MSLLLEKRFDTIGSTSEMRSEHAARGGRQDGPPSQTPHEPQTRRNSARQAKLRRRKIFWLCVLCWLMVLCVTAIIIIAVYHFQSTNSEIDQISAGALIGFGALLIFILMWSIIIYAKCNHSKASSNSRPYRSSQEEFLAFASTEIFARGVSSTISTTNSSSNTRSTEHSAEENNRRFNYRERHHEDERRAIDHATETPMTAIPNSARMTREYLEHGPAHHGRLQAPHFPERYRAESEPPRISIDSGRNARQYIHRHSEPLPPPYQPPMSPSYRPSENFPTGTPPPAYDRVCGRSRRCESTTSEDSCLNPPAYQSRPPSPSPGASSPVPLEGGTHLNVPSRRPGMGVGHPISSLPTLGRVRRYDLSPSQSHQSSSFPGSGVVLTENAIYHNSSRARSSSVSPPGVQTPVHTATRYAPPYYRPAVAPRYHPSSHQPSSTSHSALVLARNAPESTTGPVSPPYLTNRSPFFRPVLALAAPDNTTRLAHAPNRPPSPIQENFEDNLVEDNDHDPRRASVVLVYLSQAPDEEIIV